MALSFFALEHAATAEDSPDPCVAAYFHADRIIPRTGSPDEQLAVIRQSLDRMQKSGLNAIFPYFTGSSGQAYYASQIHANKVYGDRDPLVVLIQEARPRNLQVYPVLCVTVCGNDKPTGILLQHTDWALRHPDGSPLGYISPAHPDARQWLANVAREVVEKYQPDGILLDYIRYHNRPLRLDRTAEIRFRATVPPGATLTKSSNCCSGSRKTNSPNSSVCIVRRSARPPRYAPRHLLAGDHTSPRIIRSPNAGPAGSKRATSIWSTFPATTTKTSTATST